MHCVKPLHPCAEVDVLNRRNAIRSDAQGNPIRIDGSRASGADITQPAFDALNARSYSGFAPDSRTIAPSSSTCATMNLSN